MELVTNDNIILNSYPTHYEVLNYKEGTCPKLENDLSYWVQERFTRNKYYYIENNTLYIAGGYDDTKLREYLDRPINFKDTVNPRKRLVFSMKFQPRNDIQREAIRFLLGKDEYRYTMNMSQLVLSLSGGGGKTYCAIAACSILATKVLVVCHTDIIRQQWIDRIQEYTTIPSSSVMVLNSTTKMNELLDKSNNQIVNKTGFYIASHDVLRNYMKRYGNNSLNELLIHLGIGVKIVDEAHKEFDNILQLDYFTNVWKTFYLTATFALSDDKTNAIYQKCFDRVFKLKRDTDNVGVNGKITYIAQMFNTNANHIEIASMHTRGRNARFSKPKYIDYELEKGDILDLIIEWLEWCIKKEYLTDTDQFLVISPKIESCDIICNTIRKRIPELRSCVHHSKSKVESFDNYNVICVTAAMIDTGTDIDNLRGVIMTEPQVSQVNNDQLIHRLKRGKDDRPRVIIDLIDISVKPTVRSFYQRKKTFMQYISNYFELNPFSKKK